MKNLYVLHAKQTSRFTALCLSFIFLLLFGANGLAATWYFRGTANSTANNLTSWQDKRSGNGTSPTTFNTTADIWDFNEVSSNISGWTIAGNIQNTKTNGTSTAITLTLNASSVFTIGGSISTTNSISYSIGNGSTFIYNGTNQSVVGLSYQNLTLSGSGTKTAAGAIAVSSGLSIASGVTLDMVANAITGSSLTTSGTGTLSTQNTTTTPLPTGRSWSFTVDYSATAAQSVVTGSYTNLRLSGTNTKTLASGLTISGNLSISGAKAKLGAFSSTANTMSLGGEGVINGTWGSTVSAATYKTDSYFDGTTGNTGTVTVSSSFCSGPNAPIVGTITQPTCVTATGSVALSGLPAVAWTVTATPGSAQITGSTATANFTSLAASNTYTFVVKQTSTGCTSVASGNAVINAIPTAPSQPTASVTVQPTCAVSTGTIEITAPLGGEYEYQLDAGSFQSSATFTGVDPGNHTVKARLAASPTCISPASSTLTVNAVPTAPDAPTASVTVQPTCAVPTGTIVITAPTGAAYEYQLDAGAFQSSATFAEVAPGDHIVKARLAASPTCISPASSTLTVNAVPTAPSQPIASVTEQPTCAVSTGTIVVSAPTGAAYEYQLDAGAFQASETFAGVAPGNHTVTARLAASPTCTSPASSTLTVNSVPIAPDAPTASVTVQPTCVVTSGTIEISAPIGSEYEYQLDAGDYQASATFTGVAPGDHTVKARLAASPTCISAASAVLTVDAVPTIPAPVVGTITQPTCTTPTGSVELSGLPTGNWTINPGGITGSTETKTITDLSAGTHIYTVTNEAGCTSDASADVVINSAPGAPTANAGPNAGAGQGVAYPLTGSATNYASVQWTMVSPTTGGTFSDDGTELTSTFTTLLTGNITLKLTATGFDGCGEASDEVVLVVFPTKPVTWVGTTDNDWNTPTNWLPQNIPGVLTDVFIPSDAPHFPTITEAGAVCRDITVASGASLIDNGNLNIGGTITVEHSAISAGRWHYISSPVSGAVSGMFYGNFLYDYTPTEADANKYTPILGTGVTLGGMKGYALWPKTTAFSGPFVGGLNTGEFSITTSTVGAKDWNLVGNPYPSAIDWDATTGWDRTGLSNDAVYIYQGGTSWSAYVDAAHVNGGSRYIAPTQGFFVMGNGGTFSMDNRVRVHNGVSFQKKADAVVPNLVRIEISGNGYKDEAVVRFKPEATAEFDGMYDAYKRFGDVAAAAQLYTLGSQALAINSLPEQTSVPVGVKIGAGGSYTLAATELNNQNLLTLEDTETGIFTDLSANPYTFDAVAGTFDQRFKLHFSFLAVDEAQKAGAVVYSYQQTVHVNMKAMEKGDIYIYNITGQLVASKRSAQGTSEIKLPNTGNYIVKVITRNNTVVRKVFIQ